jgi:hypothetical protein
VTNSPRGLFVSYSENKNGPIDEEPMEIANKRGYLIWLDKLPLTPHAFLRCASPAGEVAEN